MVQVESLEEADQKIDQMAAEGQIDPAFLLTMAKAYSGVKETDMVQEEVRSHTSHAEEVTPCGSCPDETGVAMSTPSSKQLKLISARICHSRAFLHRREREMAQF